MAFNFTGPHYAIVELSTLRIATFYPSSTSKQSEYGGPWGSSAEYTHLPIPEGTDPTLVHFVRHPDSGDIVCKLDPVKVEAKRQADWTALRNERNRRLSASDWTQLPDVKLTETQKEAWAVYRQALRDITAELEEPSGVAWPSEP